MVAWRSVWCEVHSACITICMSSQPILPYRADLSMKQVLREVDWRNIEVLNVFLSPAGRLPARRKSKLKQCVHRHMCRQIKVRAEMRRLTWKAHLRCADASKALLF